MNRVRVLIAALVAVSAGGSGVAAAGPNRTIGGFYKAKRNANTPEAYARAERRLEQVRIGMAELEFLEAMEMEVLAHGGRAKDVRIDGYLPGASKDANRTAGPGRRTLVFGWVEHGREIPGFLVELHERRVAAVVSLVSPALAAAGNSPPRDATAPAAQPEAGNSDQERDASTPSPR